MSSDASSVAPVSPAQAWTGPLLALAVALAALLLAFFPTFQSMVGTWSRSDTFAHGFLIVPIVLFLVFLKRHELATVQPRPCFMAILPIVLLSLAWVMGDLVSVISVRQFAATLMIPALVWLVLGSQVTRLLQFPLAYLLFAVPFGEFLVPPMMDFTADFTVSMVQLSGIPIYRDGLLFELPSGRWSVVEACSGVRYLIASVALGTLYAYLIYRSFWRRIAFVGVAILVPIIANGLRAYMIVMIGHLSDMRLAAGVDHLIYGWIFFGVVIFLMFLIGTLWREDHTPPPKPVPSTADRSGGVSASAGAMAAVTALAVLLSVSGPLYAGWMNQRDLGPVQGLGSGPVLPPGWLAAPESENPTWEPQYQFSRASRTGKAVRNGENIPVGLHIQFYREQHRYGSMIGWLNTLGNRERDGWSVRRRGSAPVESFGTADRVLLQHPNGEQLVAWRWYWVGGRLTTIPHEVKAREALSRIVGGRDDAALIVLYAAYRHDPAEAEREMHRYAQSSLPFILDLLENVSHQ